ncbi:MAG TPA: tail fiber domain-containing protein, partial [Candidatus Dormibacteraeota bacterium]|nr:tail fiber domain-containing protein [Candidatus Dormibacteraeota bacterium]
AVMQYNLNGQRVLSTAGTSNLFAGISAGTNNTGFQNAFFGTSAGVNNSTGSNNAFFGGAAGFQNTTGSNNAFFGYQAGQSTDGNSNAFIGTFAGISNTTGSNNTFIGRDADFNAANTTGDNNNLLGAASRVTSGISNATAIGANASVTQSNSLILGSINGVNNATADTKVGIGTTTPGALLDVQRDGDTIPETARFTTFGLANEILSRLASGTRAAPQATLNGRFLLQLGATGHDGTNFVASPAASINMDTAEDWTSTAQGTQIRFRTTPNGGTAANDIATRLIITNDGKVGIGITAPADLLHINGNIRVGTGTTGCVRDADGTVIAGTCSSDARLKRAITPFPHLLDKLVQLQPVTFYWRAEEFKER